MRDMIRSAESLLSGVCRELELAAGRIRGLLMTRTAPVPEADNL
jgi:hypothetical protein